MAGITYEVMEKFGALSESSTGWTKELRLMNWNNRGPRYDLREWAPGDRKASRGITLSLKEMRLLQELLVDIELPELPESEEQADEDILSESVNVQEYMQERNAKKKAG